MDAKTKVRENMLRRIASRQGLRLQKSRQRDPMALDYGKYSLVNGRPGHIHVFIGQGDLDQIEEWLESGHRLNLRRRCRTASLPVACHPLHLVHSSCLYDQSHEWHYRSSRLGTL